MMAGYKVVYDGRAMKGRLEFDSVSDMNLLLHFLERCADAFRRNGLSERTVFMRYFWTDAADAQKLKEWILSAKSEILL